MDNIFNKVGAITSGLMILFISICCLGLSFEMLFCVLKELFFDIEYPILNEILYFVETIFCLMILSLLVFFFTHFIDCIIEER